MAPACKTSLRTSSLPDRARILMPVAPKESGGHPLPWNCLHGSPSSDVSAQPKPLATGNWQLMCFLACCVLLTTHCRVERATLSRSTPCCPPLPSSRREGEGSAPMLFRIIHDPSSLS